MNKAELRSWAIGYLSQYVTHNFLDERGVHVRVCTGCPEAVMEALADVISDCADDDTSYKKGEKINE